MAVGAAFCMQQTNTRAARLTSMTYDRAQANLSITCIEPHRRTSSVTSSNSKRQVSDSYAVLHVSTVVEQRASDYVTLLQPQLIPFFFPSFFSLSLPSTRRRRTTLVFRYPRSLLYIRRSSPLPFIKSKGMAAIKLLNLFALVSVALVVLSAGPVSVNALVAGDGSRVARHVRGHDAVAKRKRDTSSTSTALCKPRAASSLPVTTATSTPAATPADLGVSTASTSSSAAPAPTTTSSPAATPSSTPSSSGNSTSSGKKWGLGWPNGDASYLSNFARPNVGYLYTWSPYLPSGLSELGIEGIPMLWGYNQVSDFQNLVVAGYANYVLGPNEPNEPSQSNMSPADGASLWQQYINPLQNEGYKLISPACTNDQSGLDWYQQFFAACSGCHVDAIAFHAYTTDAQSVIDYANTLHSTYNLPVWITEFADQNYSGTGGQATMDEVWSFASTIINFVDSTDWLEVAFPFGVMYDLQGVNTDNSLLASDGYPTSLGYTYFG